MSLKFWFWAWAVQLVYDIAAAAINAYAGAWWHTAFFALFALFAFRMMLWNSRQYHRSGGRP